MPKSILLVNPISTPVQFALYDADSKNLLKKWEESGYVSDILTDVIENIIEDNDIEKIVYVNGPGSYMGIKLSYILLRTLEMTKKIPFTACSAFSLNNGKPIKAMGKLYFVKEEDIIIKKLENIIPQDFAMPDSIDEVEILPNRVPDYKIPVV